MENFKCYEIHRANMPQYGCTQQCDECKEEQEYRRSIIPVGGMDEPMMEVPMPVSKGKDPIIEAAEDWVFNTNGHKWSNNDDTAGDNYGSFKAGAEWMQSRYRSTYAELATILEDSVNHRGTRFSEDQMFFFAGFCKGALDKDPNRSVSDIFEEWKPLLKIVGL